mgnify:CR=1 FL=1
MVTLTNMLLGNKNIVFIFQLYTLRPCWQNKFHQKCSGYGKTNRSVFSKLMFGFVLPPT